MFKKSIIVAGMICSLLPIHHTNTMIVRKFSNGSRMPVTYSMTMLMQEEFITRNAQLLESIQKNKDILHIEALLNEGAYVDSEDKASNTPLHHAVRKVNLPVVELLLSRGAQPNALNKAGITPLHVAFDRDNDFSATQEFTSLIVRTLIQGGARKDAGTHYSPLNKAVIRGNIHSIITFMTTISAHNAQLPTIQESIEQELKDLKALVTKDSPLYGSPYKQAKMYGLSRIVTLVDPYQIHAYARLLHGYNLTEKPIVNKH